MQNSHCNRALLLSFVLARSMFFHNTIFFFFFFKGWHRAGITDGEDHKYLSPEKRRLYFCWGLTNN